MKERASERTNGLIVDMDGYFIFFGRCDARTTHLVGCAANHARRTRRERTKDILFCPPLLGDRSHSRVSLGRRQIPLGQEDEHKGGRARAGKD